MFCFKQKFTEEQTMAYYHWVMKEFLTSDPSPKEQREVGSKLLTMMRATWKDGAPYHVAWIAVELHGAK